MTHGVQGDDAQPPELAVSGDANRATPFRRLDHVAVAVRNRAEALEHFGTRLGLTVVHTDELDNPPVTLTYLDAGNAFIQLVSPRAECDLSRWLDEHGEGLHHVCFAVDDVDATVEALSRPGLERPPSTTGRGKMAAFIADGSPHGFLIECTEFSDAAVRNQASPRIGAARMRP
jgi:methylmalonyl-CoA/ethylmalonyl-CoA epimerase